jgi:hypothetical protein
LFLSGDAPHGFSAVPDLDRLGLDSSAAATRAGLIGREFFAPFRWRHFDLLARSKAMLALFIVRHFGSPNRDLDWSLGERLAGWLNGATHLRRYASRFSFRRPQWVFDGLASGIGLAPCSASIIPTCACISGPRSSAAMMTASPAALPFGRFLGRLWKLHDVRRGLFERYDQPALRRLDRIIERERPGH